MQRTPLTLDQIPPLLINAILATEDQRFYEHGGIDILGLIRAATELVLTALSRKVAVLSRCKSPAIFI